MDSDKRCLSPLKLFERLVTLEVTFKTSTEKDKDSLILARDLIKVETTHAREIFDDKLVHLNEYQRRMDRLVDTFATQKDLDGLRKVIWIGMGLILALQLIVPVMIHVYGKGG